MNIEINKYVEFVQQMDWPHFTVVGVFLLIILSLIQYTLQDERSRKTAFRLRSITQRIKQNNLGDNRFLGLLHSPKMDEEIRKAGIPENITSYKLYITSFLTIIGVMLFYQFGVLLHFPLITKREAAMIITLLLVLLPSRYSLFYLLLKFLKKAHKRKVTMEIYSLYAQLKAEFKSENVGNLYNLMYNYRTYYQAIRPTIDRMLSVWQGSDGAKKAWELFSKDLDTEEAKNLATLMKNAESSSVSESLKLLENDKKEFANRNVNAFKDYLTERESIIYYIIFVCVLAVFANPSIAQFLQYKEMFNQVNNL